MSIKFLQKFLIKIIKNKNPKFGFLFTCKKLKVIIVKFFQDSHALDVSYYKEPLLFLQV